MVRPEDAGWWDYLGEPQPKVRKTRKKLLLNFSHPLPAWLEKRYIIISFPFEIPDEIKYSSNGEDLRNWVTDTTINAIATLSVRHRGEIQIGKYAVSPPGYGPAAYIMSAVLRGITGHTPQSIWQHPLQEGGFDAIERPVNIQKAREDGRRARDWGEGLYAQKTK